MKKLVVFVALFFTVAAGNLAISEMMHNTIAKIPGLEKAMSSIADTIADASTLRADGIVVIETETSIDYIIFTGDDYIIVSIPKPPKF